MEPMLTISIITPSLNQGKFIEETIASVLSQEGNFILDYIIVDGGSTDQSLEIIKKYDSLLKNRQYPIKCSDVSYRWVSEKDKGQADAINKGFRMAKGDILAWLNSDDTYTAGSLAHTADFFQKNPDARALFGDCNLIDVNGTYVSTYRLPEKIDRGRLTICQPSVYFRRELLHAVGYLNIDFHYAFDYDYWVRILDKFDMRHHAFVFANARGHLEAKMANPLNSIPETYTVMKRYASPETFSETFAKALPHLGRTKRCSLFDSYAMLDTMISQRLPSDRTTARVYLQEGMRIALYKEADILYAKRDLIGARDLIRSGWRRLPSLRFDMRLCVLYCKTLLGKQLLALVKKHAA